jgi:hypothetical protein
MKCFRIQIVNEDPEVLIHANNGDDDSQFLIDQASWEQFLKTAGRNLIPSAELKCGVCGRFTVPALVFLQSVEKYEDVEHFDPDYNLYGWLVEPKFDNDEAFLDYWKNGGPDLNLLYDTGGSWVYDEISGFPLGLKCEDVVISISSVPCPYCEKLFST